MARPFRYHVAMTEAWSDDLLLSVPMIDREHREILDRATDFGGAVDAGLPKKVLEQRLAAFIGSVDEHFASEEQLMYASAYPDLEAHHAEHNRLFTQLHMVGEEFGSGKIQPGGALGLFLRVWTEQHIVGADQQFGGFLKETGQLGLAGG
ncbi:MAG: hemerythrin family protein [Acidobacteriia bacterium]|nr:hemerythrin family protein [Terriglobia bacterium]